ISTLSLSSPAMSSSLTVVLLCSAALLLLGPAFPVENTVSDEYQPDLTIYAEAGTLVTVHSATSIPYFEAENGASYILLNSTSPTTVLSLQASAERNDLKNFKRMRMTITDGTNIRMSMLEMNMDKACTQEKGELKQCKIPIRLVGQWRDVRKGMVHPIKIVAITREDQTLFNLRMSIKIV
ncbi:hypothetical protein PMAYCL1PPCAC_04221, partial [Pristionchus mayeri]